MRSRSEWQHRGGWPSKQMRQRKSEKIARPSKIALRPGAFAEESHSFGGECPGEEYGEQEKHNSSQLTPERRAADRLSAPGLVRGE